MQTNAPDVLQVITSRLQDAERGLLAREADPAYQAMMGELAALTTVIAYIQGNGARAIEQAPRALRLLPRWNTQLRVLAAQTLVNAYRLEGNIVAARRILGELAALSQDAQDSYSALQALFNLALLQTAQGELHQAAASYDRALHLAEQTRKPFIPALYIGLSSILLEWNDVDAAASYLAQGIEQTKMGCDPGIELFGYEMLTDVRWAQGNIDGAMAALTEIDRVMQHNSLLSQSALTDILRDSVAAMHAWLYLARGDLHAANRWAQTCKLPDDEPLPHYRLMELSVLARVHLANARPQEAMQLLERLLRTAEETQNLESLLPALSLLALAFYAQGDVAQAVSVLTRALFLAEPGGYMRTFIREGASMKRLLEELFSAQQYRDVNAACPVSPDYVCRLLAAFGEKQAVLNGVRARQNAPGQTSLPAEHLSARELEVLHLMADGLSDHEIAQRLVLAEGTIKTHAKRIYARLHVKNRMQAVLRAKALHLL